MNSISQEGYALLRGGNNRSRHERFRQRWQRNGFISKKRGREACMSGALHSGQRWPLQGFINSPGLPNPFVEFGAFAGLQPYSL